MSDLKVLIVGGGFAGMAAAIELNRRGAAVELLERDPDWRTDGAGISLHGASLRVFKALGIYDDFLREGGCANGFDILHPATDQTITTLPTPVVGDVDFGGAGVMRPALADMLRRKIRGTPVVTRLGGDFTAIEQDETGVTVRFDDGTSGRYDVLIGADGIASRVRRTVMPDAPEPRYVGQGVWRAVVDWPEELARPGMWSNGVIKIGINLVSKGKAYIFLTETRQTNEHIDPSTFVSRLSALLRTMPSPVLNRIAGELGPESQILYRPLFQLLVPRPWSEGRVVLIGDAIHATTPHLAAGACAAMEDSIVLAEELTAEGTVKQALHRFEDRRWERCRMIVANSGRLCEIEMTGGDMQEHQMLMRNSMQALALPI